MHDRKLNWFDRRKLAELADQLTIEPDKEFSSNDYKIMKRIRKQLGIGEQNDRYRKMLKMKI